MHLKLSFFGQFRAFHNETLLTRFESTKVRGLLAYLVIEAERTHSRDLLTGLFWPDWPQVSARRSLSQALFNLRQVIGDSSANPPFLQIDRLSVQWNRDSAAVVDVFAVEPLLRLPTTKLSNEQLQTVVDSYRGKLLDGFTIDESDLFTRWLEGRREAFHRQAMQAFDEWIRRLSAQGSARIAEALAVSERQLVLDPWHEVGHRHAIQLLALSGQRSAALAHFEQCKKFLADELGVEPESQTQHLVAQIQRGEIDITDAPHANGISQSYSEQQRQLTPPPVTVDPDPLPASHPPRILPLTLHPAPIHPAPVEESPSQIDVHLPSLPGTFVGRDAQQSEIVRLLGIDGCRLLTVIGPGGIGKTWLTIQSAHKLVEQANSNLADGIFFVSLVEAEANVMGSIVEQIVQPIAIALGLTLFSHSSAIEQLCTYLAHRQILLLLDNFESLIEGAFVISTLLAAAPGLRILASSRERLNLHEEWLMELDGLAFPSDEDAFCDDNSQPLLTKLEQFPALQLFVQNARRVQPGFVVDHDALRSIIRICRMVAGMPLGIAIASGWVRHLACAEIVIEMEQDRDFLTSTQRNMPARHRSMRAVFDYSWRLLTHEEQQSLARIAIFPQSFSRAAAKAIADAGVSLLSGLVDKSLLRRLEDGRYVLHPQLRQFALEHLEASPQVLSASRQRHAQWFGDLLFQTLAGLSGVEQKVAVAMIDQEIDHLRLGWRFAVETGQALLIDRYVPGLFHLYNIRGWYLEGAKLFQSAIAQMGDRSECHEVGSPCALALTALQVYYAEFLHRLSNFDEARQRLEKALPWVRAHQRSEEIGFALNALGYNDYMRGKYQAAQLPYQESLALFRQMHHAAGIATVLNNLGNVWAALDESGSYEAAQKFYEESLQVARASGNHQEIARALLNLGTIAHTQHEYFGASHYYQESIKTAREIESRRILAIALSNLGDVYIQINDLTAAHDHLREALFLKRKLGDQRSAAYTLNILSDVYFKLGDSQRAQSSCLESLSTALTIKAMPVASEALLQLVSLLLNTGQQNSAAQAIAAQLALIIVHHPAAEGSAKKHAQALLAQIPHVLSNEKVKFLQRHAKVDDLQALLDPLIQEIPAILAVA